MCYFVYVDHYSRFLHSSSPCAFQEFVEVPHLHVLLLEKDHFLPCTDEFSLLFQAPFHNSHMYAAGVI